MTASLLIIAVLSATSAFEYRSGAPLGLFPFPVAAIDESHPGNHANPAYLPLARHPYLTVSGTQPYGIEGLHNTGLAAGFAWRGLGVRAAFHRFGKESYREHIVECAIAYRPHRFISMGLGISYNHLAITVPEIAMNTGLVNGCLGIYIEPLAWLRISFRHDNSLSLLLTRVRDLLPPGWSAGLSLRPIPGLTLAWNINRTPFGYVNTVILSANPLKYVSISAGYSRETATFAASLAIVYRQVSVSYALRYHSHLGYSHVVGLTLSTGDLHPETISFNGRYFMDQKDEREKISIARCTAGELLTIPGMSTARAAGIIDVRTRLGRVTVKKLRLMGMTDDEIAALRRNVRGIEDDSRRDNVAPSRPPRHDRRAASTDLFKKLLILGLPASQALELAETTVRRGPAALRDQVSHMNELDAALKQAVIRTCIPSP